MVKILKPVALIIVVIFIGLCVAPAKAITAADTSPLRVVCIGDSITDGGALVNGELTMTYRFPLWKKFVDAGVEVAFLGRTTTSSYNVYKDKVFPTEHLGWGGKRIETVNQYLKDGEWGTADAGFDIAIILIGHNNVAAWDATPRPTVPEFNALMKDLIATVRAKQPNVKIIFQTTPSNIIKEYELEYKNIATQANTVASPLYYIPVPPTFKNTQDLYDGVHPNVKGEIKIANGMWNVLQYLVGAATLPTPGVSVLTDAVRVISGTALEGETVAVSIGTKSFNSVISNKTWKVTVPVALKAGTKISVFAKINDIASKAKVVYVIPATPKVSPIKANATSVKGSASKGGVVYVKIGAKTYTAKASISSGAFSVKIPKIKKGTIVVVTCKAGGKISAKKTVKVA